MRFVLCFALAAIALRAETISFSVVDSSPTTSPGSNVVFSGSLTNDTPVQLNASDFAFDFSGYDPEILTIDQLLGLSDFQIGSGAILSDVPLFRVSIGSRAVGNQSYPFAAGITDVNGDQGNAALLSVRVSGSTNSAPEPSTSLLLFAGLTAGIALRKATPGGNK